MADGQVVFEITADGKHVAASIKEITKAIESEGKKWDKAADGSTSKIEDSFSKMVGSVIGKLTAAGIGAILLSWGKDAVEAASDLREVQNVVDTVFGDGAQQIETWAKKAGAQFGLTETQAKKFTSTLGAMMKSSGLAGNQIVEMSTDLAGLAADMASFYNLDFESAFEKIRSGISGETMPLKQLGINMSVANLEAFALAQGLEKTFSQMDQGEQTMLRYQYIMQATADAQGDFSKTADGYANAQRRIQTALNEVATRAGDFILKTLEPLTAGVAGFLEKMTATPERTVIDDFNDIKVNTADKLKDLNETYTKASDLIKLLDEISKETVELNDGRTINLDKLFESLGDIEKNGGNIEEYIAGLGLDVEYVVLQYNKWKEATRQLTSLVPSLTSQIDSETGAISGGTDALKKNLEEWKKAEENKIYWAEYYAKAEAVARAKGEQAGIQITAKAKQLAAERAKKTVGDQAAMLGIDLAYYGDNIDWSKFTGQRNVMTDAQRAYNDAVDDYVRLQAEANAAQEKAEKSANDLADAESLLADELKATEELTGETLENVQKLADANGEAGEKAVEWSDAQKKAGKEVVTATENALKAVADYIQGVKDSTEQSVNSVVKGFDRVTKAGDDLRKKSSELAGEETEVLNKYSSVWAKWGSNNDALKKMAESQEKLTDAEKEAYEALVKVRNAQKEVNDSLSQYKPEGMTENLKNQIQYMEDYLKNLRQLKEWGISDELLASLSDGSKESAEYLAGLVEGGPEAAEAVGKLYDEVQEQKKGFVDALTEQKLFVDQTYESLVDKAMDSIEALKLGSEAEAAMADTVGGLVQGINSKVGDLTSAVDSVEAELNRLSKFGLSISLGPWGMSFDFSGLLDGSFETGLDRVPFNGFLAELHEGEGILTAEENRIWQRFKNGDMGSRNVDYDALGGVMRDNVHAGGDVYLDGRTVGEVVSWIQGRSYRNLQRSGWQR